MQGGWGPPPPGGFGQPQQGQYPQQQGQYPQQQQQGQYPQQNQYQQPYPQPPYGYAQGPMMGAPPAAIGPYGLTTCPRCQSPHVHRPSFTFWGGLIGPKLLNHAVCNSCGLGFNWKTGKSNTTAIAIYIGVVFGLVFLLAIFRALI